MTTFDRGKQVISKHNPRIKNNGSGEEMNVHINYLQKSRTGKKRGGGGME